MAGLLERFGRGFFDREPVKPHKEQGVSGWAVYGGYIQTGETNSDLIGQRRWKKASEILSDISVVAASVRFVLNLIARPSWSWEPADESREAQDAAEFMESVINDMDTSWTRFVRRTGMFKFHGFMAQEWIAKRREDGRIGIRSIEPRPQRTIERWDLDEAGNILGLVQRDPQSGEEHYLPRQKLLYLVDDALTDRPDGLGWFRHLVEPSRRLTSLLDLEAIGFERDLRGIPVGRAPFQEINRLVSEGKLTDEQRTDMLNGLRDFVSLQRRTSETGLVLDSKTYESRSENGTSVSGAPQWDLDLLTGEPGSIEEIGNAVRRIEFSIASIMGTEVILTGREGEGSRALSEDKSRNLYLNAQSILWDIAEAVERDIRDTVWTLNGFPDELKPSANVEDVAFKDAKQISAVLADMAAAGAVLAPDDPAIDDLRQLLGISEAKPLDEAMLGAMQGKAPEEEVPEPEPEDEGGEAEKRGKEVGKYDPDQPRDERGRWTDIAPSVGDSNMLNPQERVFPGLDALREGEPTGGLTVSDWNGGWHLSEVRSLTRGGGRAAMQRLVDLADEHGKALTLTVEPLESPAGIKMTPERLGRWYEGFGFTYDEGSTDRMTRLPKTEKFDPSQPRVPAGQEGGGRWTDGTSGAPNQSQWHRERGEILPKPRGGEQEAETIEQAEEDAKMFHNPPLTPEQINALADYSHTDYADINGYMRGHDTYWAREKADHIMSAFDEQYTTEPMTVYRGVTTNLYDDDLDAVIEPDQLMADEGFISTTLSFDTADGFAQMAEGDVAVMEIQLSSGQRAIHMNPSRSRLAHEREVLLPPSRMVSTGPMKTRKVGGREVRIIPVQLLEG